MWFIDAGAHRGESVRLARKIYGEDLVTVAIEPMAECCSDLAKTGAITFQAALWTEMGHKTLYRGEYEVSSSLVAAKQTGNLRAAEKVPTVTLASILGPVPMGESIVLKLDIEGAEYDVLEQAIELGTLARVSDLYVDFHGERIGGFQRERHDRLVERLLSMGFSLPKWIPGEMRVVEWGRKWITETRWAQ